MSPTNSGATLTPMDDDEKIARGLELEAAVEARPGLSISRLCRLAGLSNPTYYQAKRGLAEPASYKAFADALVEWDKNPDDRRLDDAGLSDVAGTIEVEIDGVFGADRVIIRGPANDAEQLAASVEAVLTRLRASQK